MIPLSAGKGSKDVELVKTEPEREPISITRSKINKLEKDRLRNLLIGKESGKTLDKSLGIRYIIRKRTQIFSDSRMRVGELNTDQR